MPSILNQPITDGDNVERGTGNNWQNFNDLETDGPTADVNITDADSDYLRGRDSDFSGIPANSTIDGIEIFATDVQIIGGVDTVAWDEAALNLADGSLGTEDKAGEGEGITSSPVTSSFGGASDLWSETISLADVQDIDWGFRVAHVRGGSGSVQIEINQFEISVFYTDEFVAGSGTIIGATETQIAAGGRTIILTLIGVPDWLATGAPFDGSRQAIIDSVDSSQIETLGWDNEIKANISVGQVARTSNKIATITLLAAETADYKITADEIISIASLPASAHTGVEILSDASFATITAECDQTLPPDSIITQTNLTGVVGDIDESVDAPDANWLLAPVT